MAVVELVPLAPMTLDAFVALVVALFASEGASEEVHFDEVNEVADETNTLVADHKYLVGTVMVKAFPMRDTVVVVLTLHHCGADDCKGDYLHSWGVLRALKQGRDSLGQHDLEA